MIFRVGISKGGETLVVTGRRNGRMACEIWKFGELEGASREEEEKEKDSVAGVEEMRTRKREGRTWGRWELPGDEHGAE
jgi:hypothetical protein